VIEIFNTFRDSLYHVLKFFQDLVEPVMGSQSYWFSIVMLTIAVRILLIPLTVKQVKSTRVMQEPRRSRSSRPSTRTTRRS
jgi:YidC/Oxa1 family membrane protein insertase